MTDTTVSWFRSLQAALLHRSLEPHYCWFEHGSLFAWCNAQHCLGSSALRWQLRTEGCS